MDDLSTKPCKCGGIMGEVIGLETRVTDAELVPYRRCWWCPDCNAAEDCIGRERVVTNWPKKK